MSVIVISVDGTPVTDDVIIAGASFISLVNGSPGQCAFQVRDDAHTYSFLAGQSITMSIDGTVYWGGYVMRARYTYPLSVMDTTITPVTVARYWSIEGVDYNILFQKRIVFKPSDPTGKLDFMYPVDTYDDTIIKDIFDNYLDISGDGLTRTDVNRVAKAFLDIAGVTHKAGGMVASAGMTWGDMMNSVARATGGVYYITPDKNLHYVDAGTVTSAYTLTDRPYPVGEPPPPPPTPETLLSDDFTRTVSPGLGNGYTHAWGDIDAGSVNGSYAMVAAGVSNYEAFDIPIAVVAGPVTVQMDFWVQSLASMQAAGYNMYYWLQVGHIGLDFWVNSSSTGTPHVGTIEILADAWEEAQVLFDPSSWYTVKATYDGTATMAKVWKRGDTEPAEWALTAPGGYGRSDNAVEIDALTLEMGAIDNLLITSPATINPDTFDRTTTSGLGNGWVSYYTPARAYVDGSTAVVAPRTYDYVTSTLTATPDMAVQFDFWVQAASSITDWTTYYYTNFYRTWLDVYPIFPPTSSPFEMQVELGYFPSTDWPASSVLLMFDESSWYTVKVEEFGGGLADGGARAKVWKRGEAEPAEWLLSMTDARPITAPPWTVELELDGSELEEGRVDNFYAGPVSEVPDGPPAYVPPAYYYVPPDDAIGYQAFSILEDGSNLVNDMFAWGSGMGSPSYVFSRTEDATSIAAHNRWQSSINTSGMYRQSTANIVSRSYVYGTPQSLRGGKDDATSFMCRVFDPVFQVAEVVPIICDIFDFTRSLPIRRMQITFANPTSPVFDLLLSNAIDLPVSIFEQTPIIIPKLKTPKVIPPKEIETGDPTCPDPSIANGQLLNTTLPVFTDDFNRASGTQPNNGEHGYWGNSGGTSTPPTFTNPPGLLLSGYSYIWFEAPLPAGIQVIAKLNISSTSSLAIGDLCGISNVGGTYGFWVADGLYPSDTRAYGYPTGDVFVRYVNFPGLYSAAKIWAQGSPEPSTWSVTGAPYLRSGLTVFTNLRLSGFGVSSYLQSITIFVEVDPTPTQVSMPPDTTTVGNLSMSWYHAWPFNEPFKLDWNNPPFSWDDFWAISGEDNPVWSVEASSRAATNTNPYHDVGIVWSMFHTYGPYTKHAHHQTEAVTIPTGYGPTGRIRVTGTVSVKVDWDYRLGENRTPTTVPVTVNLDVYDYGEGEPYWVGPPYAALGRTATSVYASCYASNGWNDPVTVPFSFDVPADMLTNIDVVGGFQWGVKIYDPEGVLRNLSGEGRGIVTAGANTAAATASVNGGSLQYAVSYAQGGGTSYFCVPACGGITDTFTRTIAPLTGTFDDGAAAWGVSDAGIPWVLSFAYSGSTGGVDGSKGYVTTTSNSGVVNAELSGVKLGSDFTFAAKFDVTPSGPFAPWSARNYAWNITLEVGDLMVEFYGNVCLDWYDAGISYASMLDLTGTPVETMAGALSGPFWVKIGAEGGSTVHAKAWRDGTTEPDWQTSESGWDGSNFNGVTRVTFAGNGTDPEGYNIDFTYAIDNLDLACSGAGILAPGQGSSGYICQTVDHAGGTSFTTLHNFAQLSLEVYVNGIRQFDFTSVGSARTFTLPEAIAADDFLRVCYNALPNLYGAPS